MYLLIKEFGQICAKILETCENWEIFTLMIFKKSR